MVEIYFVWVFTLFTIESASLESFDAGNSPEFHYILDKPVSSFGGNVIMIFFFNCVVKQPQAQQLES